MLLTNILPTPSYQLQRLLKRDSKQTTEALLRDFQYNLEQTFPIILSAICDVQDNTAVLCAKLSAVSTASQMTWK